ncbi:MAG: septum formation protein Maf [Bacteroidales bacterium]|nr:septum formation protein Maf [Bacteroidales bacterium]
MLINQLQNYRLILASKSPRRHFLLKELGLDFEVITLNEQDEIYPANLYYDEIPVYLAKEKAKIYANYIEEKTILIAADTIVWLDNEVIGKPKDQLEAVQLLKKLSGKKHEVLTGVCLKSLDYESVFCSKTNVYFRELKEDEISFYVNKFKPLDKAGAYGIQEWIGYAGVEKIEGSYFNVMGLPVQKLYTELEKFV